MESNGNPQSNRVQLRRKNHYVPQLYLKRWANGGEILSSRLLVPNHNVPLWKRHSLKGIGYRQHLYTQVIAGSENDEMERWLGSEVEEPAEKALERAVRDQRLTVDDWLSLVRFAVAQDVRTPAFYREFVRRQSEEMPKILNQVLGSFVENFEAGKLSAPSKDQMDSSGLPLKVSIEERSDGSGLMKAETVVGRGMWHWTVRRHLTKTIEGIPKKGWSILRAAPGVLWPTSDNPLIRLNFVNSESYDFDGGWNVPSGDVLLPLSPTHILHRCSGRRSLSRGQRLDRATSELIRKMIVEHADMYVFAIEEFEVAKLRARQVSHDLHREEQRAWANWNAEQSAVESA